MDRRKNSLIYTIIESYIQNPQPVSSKSLVDKFELSSATIRNEMAELEKGGYIYQPHTSAGRIPTERGYKFYVENYLEEKRLGAKEQKEIVDVLKSNADERIFLKNLAKKLADISGEAVILAFAKNDVFYTGLSNLFSKPEFEDIDLVVNLSKVIDHLDKVIFDLFDSVDKTQIKIGSDCPFDHTCSTIMGTYGKKDNKSLIVVFGPMRMDYNKNFSLIKYIQQPHVARNA